jgi:hypothetical protein
MSEVHLRATIMNQWCAYETQNGRKWSRVLYQAIGQTCPGHRCQWATPRETAVG